MNRFTIPALAFVVLSSAAVADTTTHPPATAEQCTALEKQYDAASKDKVNADKLKKAQSQRSHGADLCAQGKLDAGVKALKTALKDVGVKPAV
jgi:transaldolase